MTKDDTWHEDYKAKQKVIEAMSKEDRIKRLDELSKEIFIMANSFAGDETGHVATYLHESCNNIHRAQKIFSGEQKNEIPLNFLLRSLGIDNEPMIEL